MPADVDGDRSVVPLDALILINELNRGGSRLLSEPAEAEGEAEALVQSLYYDVNNDSCLTPLDAVQVVNLLNRPASEAEGEDAANVLFPAIAAFGQIAASPDPASVMSQSPRATIDSEAIGHSQDEVLNDWRRSPADDDLLDVLAIARGGSTTGGDAPWEESAADLLAADELLDLAMEQHWEFSLSPHTRRDREMLG
jgi:hypothetical protein